MMKITFDEAKRTKTLRERGLDFADADQVFAGPTVTIEDMRRDYGETRWISMGLLGQRAVVLVWTARDGSRRMISMRYAHDDEAERFGPGLGRP